MAIIKPFRALRPGKQFAADVASQPYDVLSSSEAKKEAEKNPLSFLHITKAEIDLPEDTDAHSPGVYKKAKENLQKLREDKILFRENKACYYIYELTMNGQSQTGLACLSSVEDYFKNVIKKHELTRPEKEKDRMDHILTTKAQTGKVFLACHSINEIERMISGWKQNHEPEYNFTASDGVQHTLWVINDDATITAVTRLFQEKVTATYIADGHHRAASAANVSKALPENGEAAGFLTVIFPDKDLRIMEYNRVVKDLNGLTAQEFISSLQEDFEITLTNSAFKPEQPHEFGMYLQGEWYILRARPETYIPDVIGTLDVSILSDNILKKILGIQDLRTDKRIDFVGGIRGLKELEQRVDSGEMQVAFSLCAVSIQQLLDIADEGKIMPPKTTWFEPKLRDGLLTHLL